MALFLPTVHSSPPHQGAALGISLCWNSQCSLLTSPSCSSSPEWQHNHLVSQPLLPIFIIHKLAKSTPYPIVQITKWKCQTELAPDQGLWYSNSDQPPAGLQSCTHRRLLSWLNTISPSWTYADYSKSHSSPLTVSQGLRWGWSAYNSWETSNTLAFSMFSATKSTGPFRSRPAFFLDPVLLPVYILLVVLHVPHHIQPHIVFGFPNSTQP